ncbi:CerR family C-terminal domain-containing protein [Sinorhizobium sp. BG8]|uniref:CerR family C-terminal domain-containing protein n=1 Tax=Sinorhizobium sp. BG8 TaxID=2613773 RepID=UPI001FEFCD0D|nr:CerR family C-terminal domain-containing protein [Sinorhizobium sp. BG8]
MTPPLSRSDAAREKLLSASIGVFGRYGFDGASTRQLAEAAGVNLQAIPYYFGSKEGLYLATAEYLAAQIGSYTGEMRGQIASRLAALEEAGQALGVTEARAILTMMAQTMVTLFMSKTSEPWARFIIREQMEPTEAFRRIYESIMGPMIGTARRLIGVILDEPQDSAHVRLRTLSFVGNIMIFRVAHAAVLKQMDWESVGPKEIETVQRLAAELVAAVRPDGATS